MSKISLENSFASHEKAIYWSDRNDKKPNEVNKNSNYKYWFKCYCGHEFASVLATITKGTWCPYCSNSPKKLCDDNDCKLCLNNSFASNPKSIYWSSKNIFRPRQLFKATNNGIYIFNCNVCNHEFQKKLCNINQGRWCPFCSNSVLCDNECDVCFNKSFASVKKVNMWSEKNILSPRRVFKVSSKKFWFKCNDCKHHFQSSINSLTNTPREKFCPHCSNQILCNDLNCDFCYNKSFDSFDKKIFWSEINILKPRQVFKCCNSKFWFNCECGHSFESKIIEISKSNKWCPYCCFPPIRLCENIECIQCFNKSFKSHDKSKYWDETNITIPRKVFKNSHGKYLFNCDNNHKFVMSIKAITKQQQWCPKCTNKTEKKLYDKLITIYDDLEFQFRANWCRNCKTNKHLPFDYVLNEKNIIIELDGKQHFMQVNNWANPEETQKRDILKMKMANENGYSVI